MLYLYKKNIEKIIKANFIFTTAARRIHSRWSLFGHQ